MYRLDLTLPTPAENLACDEALLDAAEDGQLTAEVLRFWESPVPFVVVGYSNQIAVEVNEAACAQAGVPVLRRCSGGGTVVQGPGCLNFALILRIPGEGPLAQVTSTNDYVIRRHAAALRLLLGDGCGSQGTSDLALGPRKFSGNAQRRKKHWLLFHGTFLHGFDLRLISALLHFPSRQPDYRQSRAHDDFVMNVPVSPADIQAAIAAVWEANTILPAPPWERVEKLVRERYATAEWNRKF